MTILDTIVARKREEVALAKRIKPITALEKEALFSRSCFSLHDAVKDPSRNGIIAEYKRASPSKGIINDRFTVAEVVSGYQEAGVSAVSVLTDRDFFKGSLDDLEAARAALQLPVLRKDFVIDAYQISEAKAHGADIILLIAAILTPAQVKALSEHARRLGMSVLLEVHNREELERSIVDTVDAIGVNNRNLHDFSVSLDHSLSLVEHIPDSFIKVSESGISDPATIRMLREAGFNAFLIGENFMKTTDPAAAIKAFCLELGTENK